MTRWNEGSVTDIATPPRFQREATPVWLATACALLGQRAPDPAAAFRYADLGCGTGLTALAVAATCPRAEVWGFDHNPANIEAARDLAERAGLANIRFVEASFEDLAAPGAPPGTGLPPHFDYMVAESVLSVVSPDNQRRIVELIGRRLRPGGIACLGYAADTGWTEFAPLQTVLRLAFEAGTEPSDLAIPGLLDRLGEIRTAGATYFQRNPILETRLAEVARRPAAELAHELLNRDWHPLMFADVADAMAEAKCDFVGRATLHENIPASAVPSGMVPLLEEAASIRIRETMQDLAAVTRHRRDIYRRGLASPPVAEHLARLAAIAVAGLGGMGLGGTDLGGTDLGGTDLGSRDAILPNFRGRVAADPELHGPLLRALRHGPLSIAAAHAIGPLADCPIEEAADAVALLIAGGHAHPLLPPEQAREAAAGVGRLNRALLDAIARGEEFDHLFSPVLGTGIETNPVEALTLRALLDGHPATDVEGLLDAVLVAMRGGGRSVTRDGAAVEDAAEARDVLRAPVVAILETRVPLFRRLGVVG